MDKVRDCYELDECFATLAILGRVDFKSQNTPASTLVCLQLRCSCSVEVFMQSQGTANVEVVFYTVVHESSTACEQTYCTPENQGFFLVWGTRSWFLGYLSGKKNLI